MKKKRYVPTQAEILKALQKYPDGISARRLEKYVFNNEYPEDIARQLRKLKAAGKVVVTTEGGGGVMVSYTLTKNAPRLDEIRQKAKKELAETRAWVKKASKPTAKKKKTFSEWFWRG